MQKEPSSGNLSDIQMMELQRKEACEDQPESGHSHIRMRQLQVRRPDKYHQGVSGSLNPRYVLPGG